MGMKTGRNLQAEALIEIMLKKGLIEKIEISIFDALLYRITPKGRAYAKAFASAKEAA